MAKKGNAGARKEQPPCVYGAADFMPSALTLFGVNADAVSAAFKYYGKTEATIDEAKEMIKEFMKRKV